MNKSLTEDALVKKAKTNKIKSFASLQQNRFHSNTSCSDDSHEADYHISAIRAKLDDPAYIEGAIYRLATIITNQILILRGEL
ncbi:MAG: hypothetical protein P1P63_05910 [Treponemataceae bacterium]